MSVQGIEDIYPLSPMQEGMLSHLLTDPDSRAYFEQFSIRLLGPLDVEALERAWARVTERHAVLRTAFEWAEVDEPVQVVLSGVKLPLQSLDWSAVDSAERASRLEDFLREDRERSFDLESPPLMRLALIQETPESHRLVWSHHHLLLDGWCRALLLQEVFEFYEAFRVGRSLELPMPRPYRDYIAWLKGQSTLASESFWSEQLAGLGTATPLEGKRNGSAPAGAREGEDFRTLKLNQEEADGLRDLARRQRVTLNTVLQASWALLLGHYGGRRDITFGIVVSGRPPALAGVESMIGLFINTVPVRCQIDWERGLGPWLSTLQAHQERMDPHVYLPLSEIRKTSEVPAGEPLFETLLAFQNFPVDPTAQNRRGSLEVKEPRVFEMSEFPLSLVVEPGGEGLDLWLGYDRNHFDRTTVQRMLHQLTVLLQGLQGDSGRRLVELDLLAASERQQLLTQWNDTESTGPVPELFLERFAAVAANTPEAPAVVRGERVLTYGELRIRGGQLARSLRGAGLTAESPVAILCDRTPAMAVAILAVLEAGGAFLPLDSNYPQRRLELLLEDSGTSLLLVPSGSGAEFARDGMTLFEVDVESPLPEDPGPPLAPPDPDQLAYLFYTSGSTGVPKGVGVSHRALMRFAEEMGQWFELTSEDRMLQFAPPAFDVLVEELFPVWLEGGAVVLADPRELGAPRTFGKLLEESGVTLVELPAAYWHEWMAALDAEGARPPACLRLLILGTEKPSPTWLARWQEWGVDLLQVFGLTETTVTSCLERLDRELHLPIGRPVTGTRLFVLDARLEPAPLGVVGQLFIAGEGLARGYLGRPGLTADRFIPDPHGPRPGDRLYRTGDRVRHRADGRLEFLGRQDEQIKVRGFRIEPGEVERALESHGGVLEAVVILEEEGGHRRLVAYVVPMGGGDVGGLREYLVDRLPAHMVPSLITVLEGMPRLPNGKVDRSALTPSIPEPVEAEPEMVDSKGPRNELEELFCEIWQAVLGIDTVGIHDNFFELGGDSILSIQVAARAHQHGLDLAPWQLFEHETIANLVAWLKGKDDSADAEAAEEAGEACLTPIQHWFFEQEIEEPQHWNMPLMLRLREDLSAGLLSAALSEVAEHHEGLRLGFDSEGGVWQPSVEASVGRVPVPEVDVSGVGREAAWRVLPAALGRIQGSLDLGQAPLLRALLIHLGGGERRLLLAAHHLVVDAVSWRVLAEDLDLACRLLGNGEKVVLPATTGFGTWSSRLEELVQEGAVDEELEFWTSLLDRAPVRLPLDFDAEPSANTEATTEEILVNLSAAETTALLQQVPKAYRTQANEALLTALGRAFSGVSEGDGLLVELEAHGREEALVGLDVSRTVGWLASLFPIRVPVGTGQSAGESLVEVKETLRALPRRGIGYGLLRYLSEDGARRLGALPEAEVLFNYMGRVDNPERGSMLFELASEPMGQSIHPGASRRHLLEINARVAGGRLQVSFLYCRALHRRSTVAGWTEAFLREVRRLIAHCTTPGVGAWTPSDFPLAKLNAASLARVAEVAGKEMEDILPLSPLQQGMLFHSLYESGDGVYVAQLEVTLRGNLDASALRGAWQGAVSLHGVLRTGFFWEEQDVPVQVVQRQVDLPWRQEDLRSLGAGEQEDLLQDFLTQDRKQGFDMTQAPLLRVALFQTATEVHRLVVSLHQILLDGWSLPLLLEDVFTLYEGSSLPEQRLPYRHYMAWLGKQDLSAAEAFWRQQLAGYDRPAQVSLPAAGGQGYTETSLALSEEESAALTAFARRSQVTLGTVVQGAWGILLGHYTGSADVVFGVVASGRPAELPSVESMLGLFINTLPLRVRIPASGSLGPWLEEIQGRQAEMRRYEYSPLAEIQQWSEVPHGEALFESILVFQNYPVAAGLVQRRAGLEVVGSRTVEQTNYSLTVVVQPGDQVQLTVAYPLDRIDDTTAQRLLGHFRRVLAALPGAAEQSPAGVPCLDEVEERQLLAAVNGEIGVLGEGLTVDALFRQQVARTPEAVAVVCEDRCLTYATLDARARTLASSLRDHGVGPEAPVALLLDRSEELMVALWGILEAGGTYVPLDARRSSGQLASMLADCGAQWLLTPRRLLPERSFEGVRTVAIEDLLTSGEAATRPAPSDDLADRLAYVIFTSGSTGRPKGVMVEHRQLAHYTLAVLERLGTHSPGRWGMVSSLATDLGNTAIFPCLLKGGTLHMVPEERLADAEALAETFLREPVDHLKIVPSHLSALLEGEGGAAILPRQTLVLGGEASPPGLVKKIRELAPGIVLFNHYGPTETTVGATAHRLGALDESPEAPVPAGFPLDGNRLYLLGHGLLPAPLGVAAEVCIGGGGVARGYCGRGGETAQRFLPDPWAEEPGSRLYRTGDLARLDPEHGIRLLGRVDHQVQIRGFRVEIGEVEEELGRLEGLRRAGVVVRETERGESELVAFCVGEPGGPTAQELGERARAALPPQLVPAVFVEIDALPRLPNGKVDRRRLAELAASVSSPTTAYVAPRSSLEELLVEIWQELLGAERIGIHDHFFSLGGHSLLATRLTSRIRREMHVQMPLRTVFEGPTVAEQAVAIAQLRASELDLDEVERLLAEMEQL